MEEARKNLAKYNLKGELPMKFFCSLNREVKRKAQFEVLRVTETDQEGRETELMITEQKSVEWEVHKYYWKLYRKREDVISKEDILEMTGPIRKISAHDSKKLKEKLTLEEVSKTLSNTRNNVALGLFTSFFGVN